jgi:aminomethyltransferase
VGKITSAVYSPRLKKNIALAMVSIDNSDINTVLEVEIASKKNKAIVVEKPFYDPKKKLANK